MNRGAFDFVTKPVDFADLEVTIHKTLADIAKLREIEHLHAAAERARGNLARYFSPNIVDMLADQDEPLGAVRRQTIAVLFADIVGFTRMSEAMPPEAVVTMLRQFHERMTAHIFTCGGTVDKYIGDSIFAAFGVPTASDNDAANALICADMMLEVEGAARATGTVAVIDVFRAFTTAAVALANGASGIIMVSTVEVN
jgi:adenylate cyclase